MKTNFLVLVLLLVTVVSVTADDTETIYDVNVNGTWSSDVSIEESFAKLVFNKDQFTMTVRIDGEEINKTGYFLQESKKLLLVVVDSNNRQIQMDVPYYVIDENTIEVTVKGRTFMLERVS
jgi:regulation of enolase protein 1 (concanavalin A-like superfamily)